MAFSEKYIQTTGSNLNAGSTNADAAVFTFTNGGWVGGTGVFTATGANLSGVSADMFASIFLDADTVTGFTANITAVDDTLDTVTVSLTRVSGTPPADGATGRTIKVGGAWAGPSGAVTFPSAFLLSTDTNAAGDSVRCNIKAGTYVRTAALDFNKPRIIWQGYSSTIGDAPATKPLFDQTASGAVTAITFSAANCCIIDLAFSASGATTGSVTLATFSGAEQELRRLVAHTTRGHGILLSATTINVIECEAYACNSSNTAALAGFIVNTTDSRFIRCISHDNTGSNTSGFSIASGATLTGCIADTNGAIGFNISATTSVALLNCDAYNNASDGIRLANTSAAAFYIENCNLILNGGYGINGSGAGTRHGTIQNCGFSDNTSGTVTGCTAMQELGSINYGAGITPWVAPSTGDFRISLAAAKGTGRGSFTQTAASYAGAVAYPDIGAAQHADAGGGSVYSSVIGE